MKEDRDIIKELRQNDTFNLFTASTQNPLNLSESDITKKHNNTENRKISNYSPEQRNNIEIENFGNAKTIATNRILNLSEGWIATVDSEVVIGTKTTNDDPKKTITLIIKPPIDFGYHNNREKIQLAITPSYFNDPSLVGDDYLIIFIVQSKGFSTPGFETALIFLSIIFIFITLRSKTKQKEIRELLRS